MTDEKKAIEDGTPSIKKDLSRLAENSDKITYSRTKGPTTVTIADDGRPQSDLLLVINIHWLITTEKLCSSLSLFLAALPIHPYTVQLHVYYTCVILIHLKTVHIHTHVPYICAHMYMYYEVFVLV